MSKLASAFKGQNVVTRENGSAWSNKISRRACNCLHPSSNQTRKSNTKSSIPKGLTLQRAGKRFTVSAATTDATAVIPSLYALPLVNYISQQGRIEPPVEPGTAATVFAVFDSQKKAQYIGFSKDVRNSLRTLIGRRPEFCYYYKLANLQELDQQHMLNIRKEWFSELGNPPTGNQEPSQKTMWEQPADAGSISERGKAAAAKSKAKTVLQILADRGLKEEMVFDPDLLEVGKCDIQANADLTSEEKDAAAATALAASQSMKDAREIGPNGEVVEFKLYIDAKYPTNGGFMYDVRVVKDDQETTHRIICGSMYPEAVEMDEDDFIIRTIGYLLHRKETRQTEGVLAMDQFAINYFSVSEVAQWYSEYMTWFSKPFPEIYWRFNRIHDYGDKNSPLAAKL